MLTYKVLETHRWTVFWITVICASDSDILSALHLTLCLSLCIFWILSAWNLTTGLTPNHSYDYTIDLLNPQRVSVYLLSLQEQKAI